MIDYIKISLMMAALVVIFELSMHSFLSKAGILPKEMENFTFKKQLFSYIKNLLGWPLVILSLIVGLILIVLGTIRK